MGNLATCNHCSTNTKKPYLAKNWRVNSCIEGPKASIPAQNLSARVHSVWGPMLQEDSYGFMIPKQADSWRVLWGGLMRSLQLPHGWNTGGFKHFFVHNIWDNPSHWLSYFSRWLKPPARIVFLDVEEDSRKNSEIYHRTDRIGCAFCPQNCGMFARFWSGCLVATKPPCRGVSWFNH